MTVQEYPLQDAGYKKPDIPEVVAALQSESSAENFVPASTVVYGLSDLSEEAVDQLAPIWSSLPTIYRHRLLRHLVETSESVFELDYDAIAALSLDDENSLIRSAGVDLLWTDETPGTMRRLMDMARKDRSLEVRAGALVGLARFILLGEYGDIPSLDAKDAQELAIGLYQDLNQPIEVRCRALEAVANSSNPIVDMLIAEAYADGNHLLNVSAVYAMGRTCNKKWEDQVLEELDSSDNQLVYEAVQSCGLLQLEDSVRTVGEMVLADDREIQLMAIWSLGEIGGKVAFEILCGLEETVDDQEMKEAVEDAVDAASFSLTMSTLDLEFDGF